MWSRYEFRDQEEWSERQVREAEYREAKDQFEDMDDKIRREHEASMEREREREAEEARQEEERSTHHAAAHDNNRYEDEDDYDDDDYDQDALNREIDAYNNGDY